MRFFDLHCDTATVCRDKGFSLYESELSLDIKRLERFSPAVQTFAVFIPDGMPRPYEYLVSTVNFIKSFEGEKLKILNNFKESEKILKKNSAAAIISVENSLAAEDDAEKADLMYDMGVRMASLTWNGENLMAGGVNSDAGLKAAGKRFIRKCESKGMVIDVSHLNDRSLSDVFKFSDMPLVASHSCCRRICGEKRNLTDGQIKEIISRGGLIGINFYPKFLNGGEDADFEDVRRHIFHILELGGENAVSIGSDFDGCKMGRSIKNVSDCELLYSYLLKTGIDERLADKIFFKNAFDFFRGIQE